MTGGRASVPCIGMQHGSDELLLLWSVAFGMVILEVAMSLSVRPWVVLATVAIVAIVVVRCQMSIAASILLAPRLTYTESLTVKEY